MATPARQVPRGKLRRSTEAMSQADASHSGRLLLRMPKGLHAALAGRADAEKVSLNQLIVRMLSEGVAGEPGAPAAPERVPRVLQRALVLNAVVVAFAACACIAILIVAWR
ncbi:MAG TPA: toxin-antitoxin system HicB family antitoxin [Gaiellaceae bacterium]